MEYEVFTKIVNEKKEWNPIWFALDSDENSTDNDIAVIEEKLNLKLPIEYIQFIKNFGGGYFAFTYVYSGKSNSEWYIISQNRKAKFGCKFIAFSDNGVGDYYGFMVNGNTCESKVSFYDHEEQAVKLTDFKNIFDFLIKIGLRND
ncbi:hypothetical protein SH2C18_31180 [Clostridium sediminicola]|uniref:SMI1/KNR4 family protein n=1 Tax=Clostridium sediminicola TaxID=3114879 RepID=UPI0031F24BAF